MTEGELVANIERAKDFFKIEIVPNHMARTEECRDLGNFRLNPFLDKYKANFITGNNEPSKILLQINIKQYFLQQHTSF